MAMNRILIVSLSSVLTVTPAVAQAPARTGPQVSLQGLPSLYDSREQVPSLAASQVASLDTHPLLPLGALPSDRIRHIHSKSGCLSIRTYEFTTADSPALESVTDCQPASEVHRKATAR